MFDPKDIQARLRERPFRPVRFVTADGSHYDVLQPGLVMVGNRDLMIGIPRRPGGTIYNRLVRLALEQIIGLEDLPGQSASVNGPA